MARRTPETLTVEETLYRYSNYDTPFWARANTKPGRWHAPGDGATQYLSFTTDGAWAELIRNEDLRTENEVALVRMPMWQARVDQSYIVDYSDFEKAAEAGFPADALIDDDQSRCREEGHRLRSLGYSGVLAPSAALPADLNLTLFGPRVSVAWSAVPVLSSAIPASIVTRGAPPPGLLDQVRFRGQVHSGYRAYFRAQSR